MYKEMIENYLPKCVQEEVDKKAIMEFISRNGDVLDRSNLVAHITSSAFVVNKDMTKVLFAHHNIYNSWAWVGGHNDGNPNLLEVALKETMEETGIKNIYLYSEDILCLDMIYVNTHYKNDKYVPDHIHLNAAFLIIADESEELTVNKDENSGVRWFLIDEVFNFVSEDRIKLVYKKAFDRIKDIRKNNLIR